MRNHLKISSAFAASLIVVLAIALVAPSSFADIKIDRPPRATTPQTATAGTKPKPKPNKPRKVRNVSGQGVVAALEPEQEIVQMPVVPATPSMTSEERQALNKKLYAEGVKAFNKEDYTTAFGKLQEAADNGHTSAQAMLGYCYVNGLGCDVDNKRAANYYEMAANKGDAMAQNNLGHLYEYGKGVKRDGDMALHYYTKAAEQNYSVALYNVGHCFLNAVGVNAVNKVQAGRWFRKAASEGDDEAEKEVEKLDQESQPVFMRAVNYLKDGSFPLCYGYLNEAANLGNDMAQTIMADMAINGIGTDADKAEGLKWLEIAAEQRNAAASKLLDQYKSGKYSLVPKEEYYSHVLNVLKIAKKGDNAFAAQALKVLGKGPNFNADGSPIHRAKKEKAYKDAEIDEIIDDCFNYLVGADGYEKDEKFAFKLAEMAAKKDSPEGMYLLSQCYCNGAGVKQDYKKAFKWAQSSANTGYSAGQYFLGFLYENGYGCARDAATAKSWYRRAADQGFDNAIVALQRLGY